jgi:hypothetical protein
MNSELTRETAKKYFDSLKKTLVSQEVAPTSKPTMVAPPGLLALPELHVQFEEKGHTNTIHKKIVDVIEKEIENGVPVSWKDAGGKAPIVISFTKDCEDFFADMARKKEGPETLKLLDSFNRLVTLSGGLAGIHYAEITRPNSKKEPLVLAILHAEGHEPEKTFLFCEAVGLTPVFSKKDNLRIDVSLNPQKNYADSYFEGLNQFFPAPTETRTENSPEKMNVEMSKQTKAVADLFSLLSSEEQNLILREVAPHLLPDEETLKELIKDELRPEIKAEIEQQVHIEIANKQRNVALINAKNEFRQYFKTRPVVIVSRSTPISIAPDGTISLKIIKIEDIIQ